MHLQPTSSDIGNTVSKLWKEKTMPPCAVGNNRLSLMKAGAALLLTVAAFLPVAQGQTFLVGVPVGLNPFAIGMNVVTNKIYVANSGDNSVSVIDGDALYNRPTVAVGTSPVAIAVNPSTNKIYVVNSGSDNVTVIGAKYLTATVAVGTVPLTVAVNTATNKIYVVNSGSNDVTVIDGATNLTTTVAVGRSPVEVAVNPATNKIYVANSGDNSVTVIDGMTNSVTTVAVGTTPAAMTVNPATNKIYVANFGSNNVTVIDGVTNSTTTVAVGTSPRTIAVNPVTNKIYVANLGSNSVTVIDGVTNSTTALSLGASPGSIAVNSVTNKIWVANRNSNSMTLIDGATNLTTTVTVAGAVTTPRMALAVNPVTNKIYAAIYQTTSMSVIDGASNDFGGVTMNDKQPAVAVNPATNRIYVTGVGGRVTVLNGVDDSILDSVTAGTSPGAVDVNPATNKIYVANTGSNNVTVIDGSSDATSTVAVGSAPSAVAVNPVTNKIYVANKNSNNVTVIDGATNNTTTVAAGNGPIALAVNPVTNNIYVANANSNTVTVINGLTNRTATVAVGTFPSAVAVIPVFNQIYVANLNSNDVTVIDGATNSTTPRPFTYSPTALAVNPVTNKIFVAGANPAGGLTPGIVVLVDGGSLIGVPLNIPIINPTVVAVNVASNKIYLAGSIAFNQVVIDGTTEVQWQIGGGGHPNGSAVNPISGKIYFAYDTDVTVFTEQKVQPIPLTTTIAPLPGNQFTNPGPLTLNFTTSSTYSPTAPPVQNVYYQFDTLQGPWLAATGTAPNFTGTAPPLLAGIHTVYAFATDGQFADSIQPGTSIGGQSSPIPGAMAAYVFLVLPAPASTAVALTTGTNPSPFGQPVTLTAAVTGSTAKPTGTVSFFDGSTLLGTSSLSAAGQADFTIPAPLTLGPHPITVAYSGDALYSGAFSPLFNLVVNPASSTTSLSLTSGSNPSTYGQSLTFTATVDPQFANTGPPSGTVSFYADSTYLGGGALNVSRQATLTTTLVGAGTRVITAVYSGDSNFMTNTSSALGQTVNQATSTTAVNLTLGADPSTYGQALTFTATVTPQIGGVPGGQVTFTDGGITIATRPLSGGQATLTTASLAQGLHRIRAFYAGDANFQGGTSQLLQQTVNLTILAPTVTLLFTPVISPNTTNVLFRKPVRLTATLSRSDATGTVSFLDGPTLLGSATLASGVATLNVNPFSIGQHTFTASYGGDGTFGSNVSQPVTFYVSPRPH